MNYQYQPSEITSPYLNSSYSPSYPSAYSTTTYPLTQPVSSTLTKSRIMEQNKYAPNQPLYNPLKNAVSTDINRVQFKQYDYMNAAQHSQLPTEYRPISIQQVRDIRENTYMIDQPLRPTNHIEKVEGKHFYVLDSNQKIGTPINSILLGERLAASRQKQQNIVIYDVQNSPDKVSASPPLVESVQPQKIQKTDNPVGTKKGKGGKYNLYSCLDQPFERVKLFGCKALTCPANECVASSDRPDWFN